MFSSKESKERLAYLPVSYSNKFYTLKNSIVSYMSSLFLCFVLYTDLSDNINNSVYSDNNDARISYNTHSLKIFHLTVEKCFGNFYSLTMEKKH
jgi:hypothetical protein